MSALLTRDAIDETPADFLRRNAVVIGEFGPLSQDSGQPLLAGRRGRPAPLPQDGGSPGPATARRADAVLRVPGRVRLLRNAVALAHSCEHPALPRLLNVIESPLGPVLVYAAAPGEPVGMDRSRRADPQSPYQRFARLPAPRLLGVLEVLIDLHRALAAAGWVACDLYDGCLILDFATDQLTVVDLDTYRRGPSRNDMGRMFGSARFMAPEEFTLGATLDERTTVFTLGRIAWHFGIRLTERATEFCGGPQLAAAVQHACRPSPADRPDSVADFSAAWREARGLCARRCRWPIWCLPRL